MGPYLTLFSCQVHHVECPLKSEPTQELRETSVTLTSRRGVCVTREGRHGEKRGGEAGIFFPHKHVMHLFQFLILDNFYISFSSAKRKDTVHLLELIMFQHTYILDNLKSKKHTRLYKSLLMHQL